MKKNLYLCFVLIGLVGCSKKNVFELVQPTNSQLLEVVASPFFLINDENENIRVSWNTNLSTDSISKYSIKVGTDDIAFQTNAFTKELILERRTLYYNQTFVLQAITKSGKTIQIDTLKYENDYSRFFTSKNKYIAHRGFSSLYPENTAIAFEKAADKGFEYVECDIWLTKDKKWVVIHDETIDRTSNGIGKVAQYTFDELQKFDFGDPNKLKNSYSEKIMSLENFVILCKNRNVKPLIEIKQGHLSTANLQNVLDIINSSLAYNKYSIHCFELSALYALRKINKAVILGFITTTYSESNINDLNNLFPCFYNIKSTQIGLQQPFGPTSNSHIFNIAFKGNFVSTWAINDLKYFDNLSKNNLFILTNIVPPTLK